MKKRFRSLGMEAKTAMSAQAGRRRLKNSSRVLKNTVVLGFLLLATGGIAAAESLFTLNERVDDSAAAPLFVVGAVEQYDISLDPNLVAADPQLLELELPDGRRLVAERQRFHVYDQSWKSWSGDLRATGGGAGGYVHLVYLGDRVAGILNVGAEKFQLATAGGEQRLVRLSADGVPSCALDTVGQDLSRSSGPESMVVPKVAEVKGVTQIDVLAVYPDYYVTRPVEEMDLQSFIMSAVSIANDAFFRSQVGAVYRLAYMGPLLGSDQPPATGLFGGLSWLIGEPDEVANLRNLHVADMVALFIPASYDATNACGVGNLPEADGDARPYGQPFDQGAFTVHRHGCGQGDFTFAHELGHNYGMRHDTENTSPEHLFTFGRGNVFEYLGEMQATIMGCYYVGGDIFGAVCSRIPQFSDPKPSPTGIPIATGALDRWNARVAELQVGPYSDFRVGSLVASYLPQQGAGRVEVASDSDDPPSFGFYYDETLGNYVERPGGPCNTGQNNPTYLKIRYEGDPMTSCSFQGSWDSGPVTCTDDIRNALNAGAEYLIYTDDYLTDISQCELYYPFQPRVREGEPHWLHLTAVVGGQTIERRLNFFQDNPTPQVTLATTADAWVQQDLPDVNRGSTNYLRVRTVTSGYGRNNYLKFAVSGVSGPIQSATLKIRTQNRNIPTAGFYRVFDNSWGESTITWNNASLDVALLELSDLLPAYTWHEFDVTGEVTGNGTYSFGFSSSADLGNMDFWSKESSFAPRLEVTFQP